MSAPNHEAETLAERLRRAVRDGKASTFDDALEGNDSSYEVVCEALAIFLERLQPEDWNLTEEFSRMHAAMVGYIARNDPAASQVARTMRRWLSSPAWGDREPLLFFARSTLDTLEKDS